MHNFFSMFISFLYMFRANMCPSSGEITVSVGNLSLCVDDSGVSFYPAYQTVIHTEWQIPSVA